MSITTRTEALFLFLPSKVKRLVHEVQMKTGRVINYNFSIYPFIPQACERKYKLIFVSYDTYL